MTYENLPLPFNSCSSNELKLINSIDTFFNLDEPILNNSQDNNEIKALNLCDDDLETKLTNLIDCKYYSINEIQNINQDKNFNIFHNNVNGLETKFQLLHTFFAGCFLDFEVIAITETSNQDPNNKFKTNITIEGYKEFSTSTITSNGGTTIYTKSNLDPVERLDLKFKHEHYESVWIELKNKNHKNVVCGSIYRHPHDTNDIFNDFLIQLELTLKILLKENKVIY